MIRPLDQLQVLSDNPPGADLLILDVPLGEPRDCSAWPRTININEENNDQTWFAFNVRGSINESGISVDTREHYQQRLVCSADWAVLDSSLVGLEPVTPEEGRAVPVAFGGADPLDLAARLLPALAAAYPNLNFRRYAGPAVPDLSSASKNVEDVRGATSIAFKEQGAPLALVSGGLTMYEFCRAGIPSLVLCQTDFEAGAAAELDRRGALVSLGRGDAVSERKLIDAFSGLVENPVARREMAQRAASLIDGRGTERIVELCLKLLG